MSDDELPAARPGESPQAYHRRVTGAVGHPAYPSAEVKPLSPRTPVKVTLWTAGGIIAAVFLGGWQAAIRLTHIEETLRGLDGRIATVAANVQQSDPARIRDLCREVVRRELGAGLTVECPRPTRKGESVGTCRVVLGISRDERQ